MVYTLGSPPQLSAPGTCTFLDKLPPEIRVRIYEYALTFDAPLRHSTKLRPFVGKLTGQKGDLSAAGTGLSTAPDQSLSPADTGILATSRVIFQEAIEVFYRSNTIHFDVDLCKLTDIVAPLATDLSLARRVVSKTDITWDIGSAEKGKIEDTTLKAAFYCARRTASAMFPNLRCYTITLHTDAAPQPLALLYALSSWLQRPHLNSTVYFDAVGSLAVRLPSQRAHTKLSIQHKAVMQAWHEGIARPRRRDNDRRYSPYAYRSALQALPDQQYRFKTALDNSRLNTNLARLGRGPVGADSHEFWTLYTTYHELVEGAHLLHWPHVTARVAPWLIDSCELLAL